ncbi:MAG TPA: hypothetical protein VFU16_11625 [Solirubrobacterales bacterium]|nr:hypothetical protein [Solirubrobacterales bacterium]
MSRFRILALFATVLALAGLLAACGGGSDSTSSSDQSPQQLVDDAGLEGVKSGELDLTMQVTVKGEDPDEFEINLSGPFEQGAEGDLPQLDMTAEASGDGEDLAAGITLLTDRAFIEYEDTAYEVDPTTFGFLKAALEQGQQQESKGDLGACQKAAEKIKFSQFGDNLENEGGADVDGTETTKVSGDFDIATFIDAVFNLVESPVCASQLEAAGAPEKSELNEAREEVLDAVKRSHIELYVGEDDIVRKALVEMTVAPKDSDGEVEAEIEATLTGVNEKQSFNSPSDAKPLEDLFQQLGVNPLKLLEAGQEEGLEGLLEGFLGSSAMGGSSSGGSSGGGASTGGGDSAAQKEYVECLQESKSPADLQKCAGLLE